MYQKLIWIWFTNYFFWVVIYYSTNTWHYFGSIISWSFKAFDFLIFKYIYIYIYILSTSTENVIPLKWIFFKNEKSVNLECEHQGPAVVGVLRYGVRLPDCFENDIGFALDCHLAFIDNVSSICFVLSDRCYWPCLHIFASSGTAQKLA